MLNKVNAVTNLFDSEEAWGCGTRNASLINKNNSFRP